MELRLLGAVEARCGDAEIPLGPRQRRLVFALLAWEPNRAISVERLVDLVWPGSPPDKAEHSIRVYVSLLRSRLARAGMPPDDVAILTQGPGYLLRIDAMRVDVHRFTEWVAQARRADDDQRRVALLDQALALWRGPALVDTASEELRRRLCAGIEETRLCAIEDRFDSLLRLGRHHEIVGETATLIEEHPTRERLVGQLMLALHRSGQTSRALDVEQRTRARLAEEFGIDPGTELQQLTLAILRNDPALTSDQVPRALVEPAERSRPDPVPPSLLPPAVAGFTGRADQFAELDAAAEHTDPPAAVVISAIAGTAGVGKTALAVQWAHRARADFPDGQLYVNLRGYDPGRPLPPEQALFQFLRAIGVPAQDVPLDQAEATGLFRTLLADRRMLILLDNAADAEQVRPLLPGGSGCLVLVTSRDRLDGLVAIDGAQRVTLDVLTEDEALALLGRMIGAKRVAAEPGAAVELVHTCACLPLALRITGAHLGNHSGRGIAEHLAELRAGDLLTGLQIDGDQHTAVRAAFDLSYRGLAADAQRLFRLLGLLSGQDTTADSAAVLADHTPAHAARLLDRLAAVHLVDQHAPGRYTLHDLLRRYAAERAEHEEDKTERAAAIQRLAEHYLRSADAAADLLYPYLLRLPRPSVDPDPSTAGFTTHPDALAWLDAERANLLAMVRHGPRTIAWALGDALRGYFHFRREYPYWFATARAALAAAEADGNAQAQAAAHISVGLAHHGRNHYAQAAEHYTTALALGAENGWVLGQAAALTNLGLIEERQGRLAQAEDRHTRARALNREAGARHSEAAALLNLGAIQEQRGQLDAAADQFRLARRMHRELGALHGEALARHHLGTISWLGGELAEAARHAAHALALYEETGARNDQADANTLLAHINSDAGRHADALANARAAVSLAEATGDRNSQAAAHHCLAAALAALGEHREAADHYELALRNAGPGYHRCHALIGAAANHTSLGHVALALDQAGEALALARTTGYRILAGQAHTAIADAYLATGETAAAIENAEQALAIHRETRHRLGEQHAQRTLALATDIRAD